MMKHTLVLILAMFISGCALFQSPEYERIEMPEKIHVPYYEVCPALELFETPQLPADNIDELSSYEEISRAYVQSIALLEYRIETYEDMIRACKEWEPEEENDD